MLGHVNVKNHRIDIRLPFMAFVATLIFIGAMLTAQLIPEMFLLRAVIVTGFILFLPGFMAMKAAGIRSMGLAESMLTALGLSIALIMLLGLFANFMLPYVGIHDPLSIFPLTVLLGGLLALLAAIASLREDGTVQHIPKMTLNVRPYHLYLVLVPTVTILGVVVQNTYSSNVGLVISLLLVCSSVILAAFGKIPKEAFPATIFVMSLSLLLHTSLISDFLWGWDIQKEYYSAASVIDASIWNPGRYSLVDAMLSIVVLGPVLSVFSGLEIEMVFRIVYPFIFSFMPVGLYLFFKKQTNEGIAFLSVFFIMSLVTFFTELPQLARQEIAELFVVLLLLLLTDTKLEKAQQTMLFLLYSFSLVVSHYSTYYFFIAILVIGYLLALLLQRWKKTGQGEAVPSPRLKEGTSKLFNLNPELLLLVVLFSLAWYTFTSSSAPLVTAVQVLERTFNYIMDGLFNASTIESVGIVKEGSQSLLQAIWMLAQFAFAVAIVIGAYLVLKGLKKKDDITFASINMVALGVLAGCLVLPYIASSLNSARIYHLALLFLAPSLIIGASKVVEWMMHISRHADHLRRHSLKIASLIIIFSLVFNTGLMSVATGDDSTSFALDNNRDFPRFTDEELMGVRWTVAAGPEIILADYYRATVFYGFMAEDPFILPPPGEWLPDRFVMYLGTYNIENNQLRLESSHISVEDSGLLEIKYTSSKVYASGSSEAWYYEKYDAYNISMGG